MSKAVILTWINDQGKKITETCKLVSEDDSVVITGTDAEVFLTDDGDPTPLMSRLMEDHVMFEDDHGLFGLRPEKIVSIEYPRVSKNG